MTEEEQIEWAQFETFAQGQLDSFIDRQNFIGLSINPSFENKERLLTKKHEHQAITEKSLQVVTIIKLAEYCRSNKLSLLCSGFCFLISPGI